MNKINEAWILNLIRVFFFLFNLKIIYFLIHERHTEREAETQAEGEAGFLQEARYGTQSRDSGIMAWVEGKHSTTESPRHPYMIVLITKQVLPACPPKCPCKGNDLVSNCYLSVWSYSLDIMRYANHPQ